MATSALVAAGSVLASPASASPGKPATAGPATASTTNAAPLTLSQIETLVGAPTVWASGGTGQGVDVAVLDTGVTPIAGLSGADKLVYGPDLSFDSQDPSTMNTDGYGHGTAMAGLIAGDDGTAGGFEGVAPDSRIVSVKVGSSSGAVDVSQIIAGIDWVVQHRNSDGLNIRVLNLSLGTNSVQPYQIDPLAHAAELAWRAGIVVVAAAGNGGAAAGLSDPADDPYVLAVGAEDPQGSTSASGGVVASFSAGGSAVRSPDLVAPGAYVTSLFDPGSILAARYPNAVSSGRFFRGSGTSQAAALVSGGVADLLSAAPTMSPDQVKALLMASASKIGTTNVNLVGAGLVNLSSALQMMQHFRGKSVPSVLQSFPLSTGSGLLEAARGSSHVTIGTATLTGEQDIFGDPWTVQSVQAETAGTPWTGGDWNGATWSGATWSGATWSGVTWSGGTWSTTDWG